MINEVTIRRRYTPMPSTGTHPTRYDRDTVLKEALQYFQGDELAATTWVNKYALRDDEGHLIELTPADMHRRMAREFARMEERYGADAGAIELLSAYGQRRQPLTEDRIAALFEGFRLLVPQGSVMASLGDQYRLASLSNCVVLPSPWDSYGGIFHTDEQLAQLFKRRCGVGIDISTLRPEGAAVSNAARTSTGAVSFMERFSNTTREVAQKGRRGALMITLDVAHPDILSFITAKQDLTKVTGANVSVRLSDAFMHAVEADAPFTLQWPIDAEEPEVTREVRAREIWDTLIQCAHRTAEPGVIFWDRQHTYSTSSVYPGFRNVSTNPCSEIAMQGGDSCRLIAINLHSFVKDAFTPKASFDHDRFYEVVYEGQRLMDDLVDLELEAIERIMDKVDRDPEPDEMKRTERATWQLLHDTGHKGRRTGLGFTGLADALAALGEHYGSDASIAATEAIMRTKCRGEFDSSIDMAIERGPFEAFDPAIERTSGFVRMLEQEMPEVCGRMMLFGRRNISLSTVAPTGTLSLLTRTSSGIEPVFMLSHTRRRKVMPGDPNARVSFTDGLGDQWEEFTVHHPRVSDWMEVTGRTNIVDSPYWGCTANEIGHAQRIAMQAVVQKYTTHSISSTINLPNSATEGEVSRIYRDAWHKGLKGITVYRDGSRSGVLVATDDKERSDVPTEGPQVMSRPERLEAEIVRFQNDTEPWIAVVGLLDGAPYEVFTGKANGVFQLPEWVTKGWVLKRPNGEGRKSRYDLQYEDAEGYRVTIEGLSRSFEPEFWNYAILISGMLRQRMPLPQVVEVVSRLKLYDETLNTWKNGMARVLKRFIPDGQAAADRHCGECGDPDGLYYEEGCLKCRSCGQSKCG